MYVSQLVSRLVSQELPSYPVTILPGQRLDQISAGLVEQGFRPAVVETALQPTHYQDHQLVQGLLPGATLEGYLAPETFEVTDFSLQSAQSLVRRSLDVLDTQLTADRQESFRQQGLSTHQAIILASIVEREVSGTQDRRHVAQVFFSRRELGMKLEADATYFYAAARLDVDPHPDLDSPYNTRLYGGLPPGPISNVSLSSLEAVAQPATTDYLYFVSGDDGQTYFNQTLAGHERDTAQYCHQLCQLP